MNKTNLGTRQILLILAIELILVSAAFFTGFYLARFIPSVSGQFPILFEAHDILKRYALTELPDEKVIEYGMIRGMLQAYNDPFTLFIEPAQHELETNLLEGKFGGIGARVERDSLGNVVLYPIPDSPAAHSGVIDGEHLIAIDGLQITGSMTIEDIIAAIRGPVGKEVTLILAQPPDFQHREVSIRREEVALPSVTWNLASGNADVGLIQVNIIAASTPVEVTKAIGDLQSRGASKFILDLRNNSGGLLQAGIDTASLFLNKVPILEQQYRDKPVEKITPSSAGTFTDIPLVVLINHGSASAAEIIAGSLQVNKRALLVGSPSYGKDSIQLVFDLKDGSSLHVTAARWWIPGLGYDMHGSGIIPDVQVTEEEASQPTIVDLAISKFLP